MSFVGEIINFTWVLVTLPERLLHHFYQNRLRLSKNALLWAPSSGQLKLNIWRVLPEVILTYVFILFILFLAVLGLHSCVWAVSNCGKQGLLSSWGAGHLITMVTFVVAHRLWALRLQQVWLQPLGSSGSAACGTLPDQELNPRPLRWQVDS